jgi:hypothetical protein
LIKSRKTTGVSRGFPEFQFYALPAGSSPLRDGIEMAF